MASGGRQAAGSWALPTFGENSQGSENKATCHFCREVQGYIFLSLKEEATKEKAHIVAKGASYGH